MKTEKQKIKTPKKLSDFSAVKSVFVQSQYIIVMA